MAKYDNLLVILFAAELDREALAVELDNLIRWKKVKWLPRFLANWLERNDDRLFLELVDLLVAIRDEAIASGASVAK